MPNVPNWPNQGPNLTPKAFERTRVQDPSDVMPTLCASYSRQHLLSEGHLQNKGIFAVLQHASDGFRFFPPGLFISMFGAVEPLVFPTKIQATFQVLGNAITVPQCVLALAIGFLSITGEPIDPLKVLRQAWADRITAWNATVFHQGDFVHIVPRTHLHHWVSSIPTQVCRPDHTHCRGVIGDVQFEQWVPNHLRGSELFHAILRGPHDLLSQCRLVNHDVKSHSWQSIAVHARANTEWQIYVHYCSVGQWETNERKWETNERKWETSQPQTRDHKHPAWETMKRTGRHMKRSGKGSGRQAGREPDK